jgi:hypothetical protein
MSRSSSQRRSAPGQKPPSKPAIGHWRITTIDEKGLRVVRTIPLPCTFSQVKATLRRLAFRDLTDQERAAALSTSDGGALLAISQHERGLSCGVGPTYFATFILEPPPVTSTTAKAG